MWFEKYLGRPSALTELRLFSEREGSGSGFLDGTILLDSAVDGDYLLVVRGERPGSIWRLSEGKVAPVGLGLLEWYLERLNWIDSVEKEASSTGVYSDSEDSW